MAHAYFNPIRDFIKEQKQQKLIQKEKDAQGLASMNGGQAEEQPKDEGKEPVGATAS